MADPRPFNAVADRYDSIYDDRPCRTEDEELLRELRPLLPGENVLDVGCGTGWLLDHAGGEVGFYVGMDVSAGLLERARRKHPYPGWSFIQADMSQPWTLDGLVAPESFGLVLSLWCSASYAAPEHFMREAARALRPGGTVLAMPHAPGSWQGGVRGDRYLPPQCYNGTTGWRPWTVRESERAVHGAGLELINVRGFRASPRLPERLPLSLHRLARQLLRPCRPDEAAFLLVEASRP